MVVNLSCNPLYPGIKKGTWSSYRFDEISRLPLHTDLVFLAGFLYPRTPHWEEVQCNNV